MKLTPTPLPKMKVFILCMMQFAESASANALFAYLGYMVLDFNVGNEKEVGYYTGLIGSSFFISQFLSNYFWGALSDKVGRRPVLLCGMIGAIVSTAFFGFSKSVAWALVARSVSGFLNGNAGVIKTYLAEITDSTNQSAAFGFFGLAWGLGSVVGPMSGGYLSQPAQKYDGFPKDLMGGIFQKYPFLLPNLLISIIILFVFIVSCFYLVETRRKGYYVIQDPEKSQDFVRGSFHITPAEKEAPSKWRTFKETVSDRTILIICALYGMSGLGYTFIGNVYPIWAMTKISDGGLSFGTNQIGLGHGCAGFITIMFQLLLYNRITQFLGVIMTFRVTMLIATGLVTTMPLINLFAPQTSLFGDLFIFWSVFICMVGLYTILTIVGNTTCSTLINNSVPHEKLGGVNGLAQSAISLARSIGPAASSYIFLFSSLLPDL